MRLRWNEFCKHLGSQPTQEGKKLISDIAGFRSNYHNPPRDSNYRDRRKDSNYRDPRKDSNFPDALLELLSSRRGAGATDPRDYLFALLSIVGVVMPYDDFLPRAGELLQVDYSKSCTQVFEEIAQYFIAHQGLGLLSIVEAVDLDQRRPNLASWAPDWATPLPSPPWTNLEEALPYRGYYHYKVGPSVNLSETQPGFDDEQGHLVCYGVDIDEVAEVTSTIQWSHTSINMQQIAGEFPLSI
jgi:hypothetical protein